MLEIEELLPETVVKDQFIVDDEDKLPEPDCRVNKIDEPAHTLSVSPGIWVGFVLKSATCPQPILLTTSNIANERVNRKEDLYVVVCKKSSFGVLIYANASALPKKVSDIGGEDVKFV